MKKISLALLCALISCPVLANDYGEEYDEPFDTETYTTYESSSTSSAENRDTYAGIRIHRNEHIAVTFDRDDNSDTTIRDNNFGFGLNIGNRLTDNVKIEFETMYTGLSESRHATDFDYDIWSNMLNIYLFKNYGPAVEPYVGLGVGLSGIWGDINGAWTGNKKLSDCEFDLSFALTAGVNFSLNKYVDLNLGLRYVDYGDIEHKNAITKIDATEIYIGAAYKFGIFK